jgi:tRNA(Ile)-lysidine synthase
MKRTEEKVIKFINEKKLLQKGDSVLVALSGGADSVFLLYFLYKFAKMYRIKLASIHINHKLRGVEADEDEQFCKTFSEKLNIPFHSVKKDVKYFAKKNKISIEEAGREIRYKEFFKLAKKYSYSKIATAHHSSDNTETVFLNLIKGAGLKGIAGIPASRGNIIRPILSTSKHEILAYLKKNKISFRTDVSNESNKYERNFLRNQILPLIKEKLNPSLDDTIFNSSEIIKNYLKYISHEVDKIKKKGVKQDADKLLISVRELESADEAIQAGAVISSIEQYFNLTIEYAAVKSILGLLNKQTGRTITLPGEFKAIRERENIIIFASQKPENIEIIKISQGEEKKLNGKKISIRRVSSAGKIGADRNEEFISGDNLKPDFIIRRWKAGDRFIPFGSKGSKKISDFLNEQKIPSHKKSEQLLLINDSRIVWVIGLRLDNRFKIEDSTKYIMHLCLKNIKRK